MNNFHYLSFDLAYECRFGKLWDRASLFFTLSLLYNKIT
jgi:hypothetical protein